MLSKQFFISESVMEGYPDKICDQVSDAVLDMILAQNPDTRVACETCCTIGMAMIMGGISTSCYVDIPSITQNVVLGIRYDRAKYGFGGTICSILAPIDEQSKDIAFGVDHLLETGEGGEGDDGARDQGMVFDYVCDETPEYMPIPIPLAHHFVYRLTEVGKDGILDYLRPDGKAQITAGYESDRPKRVGTTVIFTQYSDAVSLDTIREDLKKHVIDVIIDADMVDTETKICINPTGHLVIDESQGDNGLTGRKIVVDTYGDAARHGGGAFSGKDPTKVDHSAAYATRYVAKNTVAVGLACKCEIQFTYTTGVVQPVSALADTFGTGVFPDEEIVEIVRKEFDPHPAAIIRTLELRKPIYRNLTAYDHFDRDDLQMRWENTEPAERLKTYVK